MYRTHTCWELNKSNAWNIVTICWWSNKIRNLWWMTFIDLRDRYGITQVTFDPNKCKFDLPEIKSEYVLQITGEVIARPDNMINKEMTTGEVEILPTEIKVLSTCKELPFSIDHENPVGEELRLEYRYLDLRRQLLKNNMIVRHKLFVETLNFFDKQWFLHIETPTFVKNTPEWSREYVVPARFDPGKFFVLPQSPQQLKQMLMVSGMDKYFQLARCYRDEDPRGDRQPEFTQLDMEMSFITQEEVLKILEDYCTYINNNIFPHKTIIQNPFPVLTRQEAMDSYGSDKPEFRIKELTLQALTDRSQTTDFSLFKDSPCTKAIVVNKEYWRSEIEKNLLPLLQSFGSKGLPYLTFTAEGPKWSVFKGLTPENIESLQRITWAKQWDTVFFQIGEREKVVNRLWVLRNKLIADLWLLADKKDDVSYSFLVDFPLFELGSDWSLWAVHHPFTKPKDEDIPFVKELGKKISEGWSMTEEEKTKLLTIKADCYDIIMNWNELWWWSIRIHDKDLQHAIFAILWLSNEQIKNRFWHLLKCFEYWVPPHGWCALGFDRLVMIYQNLENIRDAIAFPKNQKYRDLMMESPSEIDDALLDELWLKVIEKEKDSELIK